MVASTLMITTTTINSARVKPRLVPLAGVACCQPARQGKTHEEPRARSLLGTASQRQMKNPLLNIHRKDSIDAGEKANGSFPAAFNDLQFNARVHFSSEPGAPLASEVRAASGKPRVCQIS